jgi:hypothetical protein
MHRLSAARDVFKGDQRFAGVACYRRSKTIGIWRQMCMGLKGPAVEAS